MKKSYSEPLTKTGIVKAIAEDTELSSQQVKAVLNSLFGLIEAHIKPRSSTGIFRLPGMLKIHVVKKAATKARKNVPNPFRPGETMDVAAKPASRRVKITPLKPLKDMA